MPAPKTTTTPDFMGIPSYAQMVAEAIALGADTIEKNAVEAGQSRVLAPVVQMVRRASVQVQKFAEPDDDDRSAGQ